MLGRGQITENVMFTPMDTGYVLLYADGVDIPSSFWTWLGIPMMVVRLLLFLVFSNLFTGLRGLNVEPERKKKLILYFYSKCISEVLGYVCSFVN